MVNNTIKCHNKDLTWFPVPESASLAGPPVLHPAPVAVHRVVAVGVVVDVAPLATLGALLLAAATPTQVEMGVTSALS